MCLYLIDTIIHLDDFCLRSPDKDKTRTQNIKWTVELLIDVRLSLVLTGIEGLCHGFADSSQNFNSNSKLKAKTAYLTIRFTE